MVVWAYGAYKIGKAGYRKAKALRKCKGRGLKGKALRKCRIKAVRS